MKEPIKVTTENPNSVVRYRDFQGHFVIVMALKEKGDQSKLEGMFMGDIHGAEEIEAIATQTGTIIAEILTNCEGGGVWMVKAAAVLKFIKALLGFKN